MWHKQMMNRMKTPNLHCTTSWIATLILVVACSLLQTTLFAQQGGITPNYREADIREVIEAVQAVTGKTFIVDARVNAKVTLLASEPMSNEEFYAAFLSILRVNSFQAQRHPTLANPTRLRRRCCGLKTSTRRSSFPSCAH